MFLILPIISFSLLFLIFSKKEKSWRSAVLSAAIVWGILITEITELLNLLRLVNFLGLFVLWLLTNFILCFIFFRLSKKTTITPSSNSRLFIQPFYILSLICVAFITLTVGLTAIIAPPNNWDSMTYHMPRIVHWIQNHSVAHYPTSYTPQLYQPPWAEFTIMHFQILSGSDRFANLVQWFSMVGSLIGVSLIAKELGADLRGQVLSIVVSATIPMGIFQASNTKNDYVVSFWLVCFVHYVLLTLNVKINWIHLLKLSASLGLAVLTKGTAYIYTLPFILWVILLGLKQAGWKVLRHCLAILAVVGFINFGYYMRNFDVFCSPLSTLPQKYTNDVFSIPTFISNVIRNAGLHMAIPLAISSNVNSVIEKAIYQLHIILGVDINDPRTTWPGTAFSIQGLSTFEDTAGNPIHFWLLLFVIVLSIKNCYFRKHQYFLSYLLAVTSSVLLFCFLLKWQPWHSRLHLPIFVLFSPVIGVALSSLSKQSIVKYLVIILIQTSLVFILFNQNKPVIADKNILNSSRVEQYFTSRNDIKKDYTNAANFVEEQKCKNIGLSLRPDAWEYPLWILLNNTNKQYVRIEHINVKNISVVKSSAYPFRNFIPCAIISVEPGQNQKISIKEGIYVRAWQSVESPEPIQVFLRQ